MERACGTSIEGRLGDYVVMLREMGAIRSPLVDQAFRTVRRDRCVPAYFPRSDQRVVVPQDGSVPDELLDVIYSDRGLITRPPQDSSGLGMSSTSAPSVVASMLEALELTPGMRVLEIGAGTGYNAALIATITDAEVVSIDVGEQVVAEARAALQRLGIESVAVLDADGYDGDPTRAPYQRVIATVGCTGVSPRWLDQIDTGGLILAPIAHGGFEPVIAVRRQGNALHGRAVRWASFMPAAGPLSHYSHGLPRELPATDITTHRITPELDEQAYGDLWFHLAARDARVTRALMDGVEPARGPAALVDDQRGAAFVQHEAVRLAGAPSLLDEVTLLVREWEDLGRPRVPDWSCELRSAGPAETPVYVPGNWTPDQQDQP